MRITSFYKTIVKHRVFVYHSSCRNDTALKTIDRNLWRKNLERWNDRLKRKKGNEKEKGAKSEERICAEKMKKGKKSGISRILCTTEAH